MKLWRGGFPLVFLAGVLGCSQSTAYWMEQLRATDPTQRVRAVHALQVRRQESAVIVPVLVEALRDENTHVRRDAARALGQMGPQAKDAVAALQARLSDAEPAVRKAAALSLQQINPPTSAP